MELYRQHRPRLFKDVHGQAEVVATIQNMIKKKKVPHAIMLSGPSGVGKTTIARILKEKLGVGRMDFVELNAASSRGIDDIRNIEKRMNGSPIQGHARMWLIDECHKLTNDAQNGLLKLLEDPPSHVYFILATTNDGKIIDTIKTRCARFVLKSLTPAEISKLVVDVAEKEGIELTEEVRDKIVDCSKGSGRMALVHLDRIGNLKTEAEQLRALIPPEEEAAAFELVKMLVWQRAPWGQIAAFLKKFEGDAEQIRHLILSIAAKELLKGGKGSERAYTIIQAFRDAWYECGKAGLVAGCYEVATSK